MKTKWEHRHQRNKCLWSVDIHKCRKTYHISESICLGKYSYHLYIKNFGQNIFYQWILVLIYNLQISILVSPNHHLNLFWIIFGTVSGNQHKQLYPLDTITVRVNILWHNIIEGTSPNWIYITSCQIHSNMCSDEYKYQFA